MEYMKEDRLQKAKQASRRFQHENSGRLPTYRELSVLTGYTVNSLGILSCRYNVELCRLLTKAEKSENMKKALRRG